VSFIAGWYRDAPTLDRADEFGQDVSAGGGRSAVWR
jgi:hypothetical protein